MTLFPYAIILLVDNGVRLLVISAKMIVDGKGYIDFLS
jgi:hypothetical protein